MRHLCRRSGFTLPGFTLMEVIIAVAIVGIMAAAIGPVAFQQINRAKSDATARELESIKAALEEYYADTGSFPDPDDALGALVSDPGDSNWLGPYLGQGFSDPLYEVSTDAFGLAYIYDSSPTLVPAGFAELVVASKGANRRLDLTNNQTAPGQTWNMSQASLYDDRVITISMAGIDREKTLEAEAEIEALRGAVEDYYRENGSLPDSLALLAGDYLSPGIDNDAFKDGWQSPYLSWIEGTDPSIISIASCGPNRADESGSGDDLLIQISDASLSYDPVEVEVEVYRDETLSEYIVRVAQDSVDAHPEISLGTTWGGFTNRWADFNLTAGFEDDEWDYDLRIKASLRKLYSCGSDNNAWTTGNNVPPGIGPD